MLKAIKAGTKATIPAWQVDISASVDEIETYEVIVLDGDGEEDSGQFDLLENGQAPWFCCW